MPLLPSLLLLPVLLRLFMDLHAGGLNLVLRFWQAALQPSLDPMLLRSLLGAVATTLLMAVLSWVISTGAGLFIGLLCSQRVARLF